MSQNFPCSPQGGKLRKPHLLYRQNCTRWDIRLVIVSHFYYRFIIVLITKVPTSLTKKYLVIVTSGKGLVSFPGLPVYILRFVISIIHDCRRWRNTGKA